MKILLAALIVVAFLLILAYASTVLIWKVIQKYTPSEIVIGQVRWIQKAKIPGFKQILFSYTKKGKPCEIISRPIWYKKKFKMKGKYKIQIFYRKIGERGTTVWADPVSSNRVGKP